MLQQTMLQKGLSKHTPHSSNSTRLPSGHKACRAAQDHINSSSSTARRLTLNTNVTTADWSTVVASSSSTFHVVRGQHWLQAAAIALLQLHLALAGQAAELVESNINNEGNVPSELSAAGETAAPALSSLMAGSNRKQVEGCTRKCVPTCIRGGEGSPGLGPLSVRKETVVFKDGFRSRQYCLSECAQVCSLKINKDSSSTSSSSSS